MIRSKEFRELFNIPRKRYNSFNASGILFKTAPIAGSKKSTMYSFEGAVKTLVAIELFSAGMHRKYSIKIADNLGLFTKDDQATIHVSDHLTMIIDLKTIKEKLKRGGK